MSPKLLLLMGPSGCGKTTVVRHLQALDCRFTYISPYVTRALRPGETDKIAVTDDQLQQLWERGDLLIVNELYGIKYGTPRHSVHAAFDGGNFPVIDWPITKLHVMERAFARRILRVYLMPPSADTLKERLSDRQDLKERLAAGLAELEALQRNDFAGSVDLFVVNETGNAERSARIIYDYYLGVCDGDLV